ncbi:hypothetical protein G3436_24435 [Pseudomonas sp. MAFF212427]|uniref:Acyl-CoA transferase n=2 Tax=Pseudomonas brassicae TaxID=2708063 RepID=A0A6B3NWK7_9PSED|nr:hypothetical protein [Pseudomonas brassicae]
MSDLLDSITQALGLPASAQQGLHLHAAGALPSTFAVTELASASIAAAGLAMARLLGGQTGLHPAVHVDRRLSSMWFATSIRPAGLELAAVMGRGGW